MKAGRTTVPACTGHPFDSYPIANLQPGSIGSRAELDYLSDSFMAANLSGLGWVGEQFPLVISLLELDYSVCAV